MDLLPVWGSCVSGVILQPRGHVRLHGSGVVKRFGSRVYSSSPGGVIAATASNSSNDVSCVLQMRLAAIDFALGDFFTTETQEVPLSIRGPFLSYRFPQRGEPYL